jgi:hypothetical protein
MHGLLLLTRVGVQLSPAAMYSHPMTGVAAHTAHPGLGVTDVVVPVFEVAVVLVAVVEVTEMVSDVMLTDERLLLDVADESVFEALSVADRLDTVVIVTLKVESEVSERDCDEREVAEMELAVEEVRVEVREVRVPVAVEV